MPRRRLSPPSPPRGGCLSARGRRAPREPVFQRQRGSLRGRVAAPHGSGAQRHACAALRGSAGCAAERGGGSPARAPHFGRGEPARPSQVSDGFCATWHWTSEQPPEGFDVSAFSPLQSVTSTRGNTLRTCAEGVLAFITLQWLNNHLSRKSLFTKYVGAAPVHVVLNPLPMWQALTPPLRRQSRRFMAAIIPRVWTELSISLSITDDTEGFPWTPHAFQLGEEKNRLKVHFSVLENTFPGGDVLQRNAGAHSTELPLHVCVSA